MRWWSSSMLEPNTHSYPYLVFAAGQRKKSIFTYLRRIYILATFEYGNWKLRWGRRARGEMRGVVLLYRQIGVSAIDVTFCRCMKMLADFVKGCCDVRQIHRPRTSNFKYYGDTICWQRFVFCLVYCVWRHFIWFYARCRLSLIRRIACSYKEGILYLNVSSNGIFLEKKWNNRKSL